MIEKLKALIENPTVSSPVYLCLECEEKLHGRADACPECGGEVEKAGETFHTFWTPL